MTRAVAIRAAALAAAALVLYGTRLEHTPAYLHDAEILFGLQAHAIATTAHDLSGRLMPLYFQMSPIGENVWFHPVLVYVTALFLKIVAFGEWAVRLPSAFVGALDVVLMYAVARRLFGRERDAIVAAILLALTPAHFIHSRIAMDYLYPVPFVLGWLLALAAFLDRQRLWMLFVATSLLGIGVYSYIASVAMMPVYFVFTIAILWLTGHASRRSFLAAAAGFLWPLVVLPLWLWYHPSVVAETFGRYRAGLANPSSPLTMLASRISLYWSFFDPAYLFVSGGYANVVNSTRHAGVFALPLIGLVPFGVFRAIRTGSALERLVLAGFVSAPLAACLAAPEPYAIDRELAVVPFGILLAVCGVRQLESVQGSAWRALAAIAVALVPLHFAFFYWDYFTDYRRVSAVWFELNHRAALEEIVARDSRERVPAVYLPTDGDPYMDAYWRFTLAKLGRADLRKRTVFYTAKDLDVSSVSAGSLVLMRRDATRVESLRQAGHFRMISVIPEVADPPEFFILQP